MIDQNWKERDSDEPEDDPETLHSDFSEDVCEFCGRYDCDGHCAPEGYWDD